MTFVCMVRTNEILLVKRRLRSKIWKSTGFTSVRCCVSNDLNSKTGTQTSCNDAPQ